MLGIMLLENLLPLLLFLHLQRLLDRSSLRQSLGPVVIVDRAKIPFGEYGEERRKEKRKMMMLC